MTTIDSNVDRLPPLICLHATDACANSYARGDAECSNCGRPHAGFQRRQRTDNDIHISQENTLIEMLAELKHIRAALAASGSVSSAQLEQDSKGQVKLTVKAYAGSDVESAGTAALDEFGRLFRAVEEQQRRQWSDTVTAVAAAQAAD